MNKILLLNPPSTRLYIKDYYCSFSPKARYCWPPQDLVILSGILGSTYQVDYLDPYGLDLDSESSLEKVLQGGYYAVIFTTGSASLAEDLAFIKRVKTRQPSVRIVGSSALFIFAGEELMRDAGFIDGAILDFTSSDILYFLSGEYNRINNMWYRDGDFNPVLKQGRQDKVFSFPVPKHGLFNCKHYMMPPFIFNKSRFITTIASVGCPFQCTFCSAAVIKYRQRETDNLMEELRYLREMSLVRNIFFADCHFTADLQRTVNICEKMIADYRGIFSWICNSRAEPLLDSGMLRLLKLAGCRMVMLGAESADQRTLQRYKKNISVQQIKEAVDNCRKQGIYTLVYFILGLPGEGRDSLKRTEELINWLGCDFISISFAVPDLGTGLRAESLSRGWCANELGGWDHSRGEYLRGDWREGELERARDALYKRFYLRPSWALRRIKDLHCLRLADLKEGVNILKNWL